MGHGCGWSSVLSECGSQEHQRRRRAAHWTRPPTQNWGHRRIAEWRSQSPLSCDLVHSDRTDAKDPDTGSVSRGPRVSLETEASPTARACESLGKRTAEVCPSQGHVSY